MSSTNGNGPVVGADQENTLGTGKVETEATAGKSKPLHISQGTGVTDNRPTPLVTTWDEFAVSLATSRPVPVSGTVEAHRADLDLSKPQKLAQPYYIPGECRGPKKADNVDDVCLYVADLDGISLADLETRLRDWNARGLAYVVTSTWKHGLTPDEEGLRLRVVFPLARVVDGGKAWPETWANLTAHLGLKGLADEACKNADRLYFYPAHPTFGDDDTPAAEPFYLHQPGNALVVVTPEVARKAEAHSEFIRILGDAWPNLGNRHQARLALAGALYKSGVAEAEAERLVTEVNRAGGSDDDEDAAAAVAHTYQKDPEDVSGWGSLGAIVGDDIVHEARRALGADAVDRVKLADLAATLKRKKIPSERKKGELLERALGNANLTPEELKTAAELITEACPSAGAEAIADVLKVAVASVQARLGDAPDVVAVVERVRADERAKADRRKQTADEERKKRIREAIGRDEGYTKEEAKAWGERLDLEHGDLTRRLFVQNGSDVYVFVGGNYRSLSLRDAGNAAETDLAPAHTLGVTRYTTTANGDPVLKSLDDLIREYGCVVDGVEYDFRTQAPVYVKDTRRLRLPACVQRDLKPAYSAKVQGWLEAFGDPRVVDWVSVVTQLDRPCAALYLLGESNSGKSLLATGLSRIWTDGGVTDAGAVTERFTHTLLRCPLIFADEVLPDAWRTDRGTGKLRKFIQDPFRLMEEKNKNMRDLLGATRLILASNGDMLRKTSEELNRTDGEAIDERFVRVDLTGNLAPREYLRENFGVGPYSGEVLDEIACHALWLRDNHTFETRGRYFFKAQADGVGARFLSGTVAVKAVRAWLYSFAGSGDTGGDKPPAFIEGGHIWVRADGLASERAVKDARVTLEDVAAALRVVCLPSLIRKKRSGVQYRCVDKVALLKWAAEAGLETDALEKALAVVPVEVQEAVAVH